jgi:hypothetical protein
MVNYIQIEGSKIELTQQQVEQIKSLGITKKKSPQWEDFGEIKGCYITEDSYIAKYTGESNRNNENVFPTEEETKACLALSQLCQWRDKYNRGWKPDWESLEDKYCLYIHKNNINPSMYFHAQQVLSFRTEEIRDKFLEDFRDLIEIAKPLL